MAMAGFEDGGRTIIGRLRVAGAGFDPLLARLRAAHLLETTALQPKSLPPAAILCVRALRDPLPHTLTLDQAYAFPASDWTRAIADQLDHFARTAVRPLWGNVPAMADAVLFADRAEMLACLALDSQQELVFNRWWWHQLLRTGDAHQAVIAAWVEAPEDVPAALVHLTARGAAGAWVRSLPMEHVDYLVSAIVERFGLRAVKEALDTPTRSPAIPASWVSEPVMPASLESESVTGNHEDVPVQAPERNFSMTASPWSDQSAASQGSGPHPKRQLLLGLSVMLSHQPARVRTVEFARQVSAWLASAGARFSETPIELLPGSSYSPAADQLPERAADVPLLQSTHLLLSSEAALISDQQAALPEDESVDWSAAIPMMEPALDASFAPRAFNWNAATPRMEPALDASFAPPALMEDSATTTLVPDREVHTSLGGLFYLINVALALELYGDFTTPLSPGLNLPIWDFLALMGEAYLGDELRQDPLWALLAKLSGRGDEPPGHGFKAPTRWQAPDEWQNHFDLNLCTWAASHGRIRVWHDAGFWLMDVPARRGQPVMPAGVEIMQGAVPLPRRGRLNRWVDWWAVYLRARLCCALALDDANRLAAVLFRYPARIVLSSARLDVMLRLDDLALEVRLAGLDRNPAWVPAAGRWIAFHFD